jgi:hydrogenase maturation protein HypF
MGKIRVRLRVRGTVQGVGFRPFVYGLADRLRLAGFVLNDSDGVLIEVEGPPEAVSSFRGALAVDSPPLAAIEEIDVQEIAPEGSPPIFAIHESRNGEGAHTPIPPDVATCPECLEEILDPGQRRYRYPFTNCTNCGPRFTITTRVPYDRPHTTMSAFEMCPACRREYEDPSDRRFHAQPIACPACGPRLHLSHRSGSRSTEKDVICEVSDLLRRGQIVALKGLGGYHLVCDATEEDSVAELRRRKRREEKPLAVMVGSPEEAQEIIDALPVEVSVLTSRRRPIVLLERVPDAPIAPSVAPNNRYLGVMLPYTPLHHLLMQEVKRPLVMTSGNVSDEPIAFADDDAHRRLGPIADVFVSHDRVIHTRCDDSVVRVVGGKEYPIRRSRGYAPEPLLVAPLFARAVLAAGPELKHTFCIGKGRRAIVSHHIGDLETWEAMSAFLDAVEHFTRTFDVVPEVIAHDLHPDYLSTKWALEIDGVSTIGVQHHHAHIASCLADNGRWERVIGLALDGTGYGEDGALWGCEVLAADLADYDRHLHLGYVPMPGGTAAIREPWRMAAVYLDAAFVGAVPDVGVVRRNGAAWDPVLRMIRTGVNSPRTSSAGRLFDAAASICGVRDRVSYEGQAASELEQLADPSTTRSYPCPLIGNEIDGVALVGALAEDIQSGTPVGEAAAAFHNGLAGALVAACEVAREREGLKTVALSGGTWQNTFLLERVRAWLADAGFEVLIHGRVPANDGGISLGQAMVANARVAGHLDDRPRGGDRMSS